MRKKRSEKSEENEEKWRNLVRKWSRERVEVVIEGAVERESMTGIEKVK